MKKNIIKDQQRRITARDNGFLLTLDYIFAKGIPTGKGC